MPTEIFEKISHCPDVSYASFYITSGSVVKVPHGIRTGYYYRTYMYMHTYTTVVRTLNGCYYIIICWKLLGNYIHVHVVALVVYCRTNSLDS